MEPWRAKLAEGDTEAAWDLFIDRYRRLIMATLRRIVENDEDVLDVFAHVCHALSANELARLRRYRERAQRQARFSTWLVTVVRHQVIDWIRHHEGRPRVSAPGGLSPMQQKIFAHVFVEKLSHAEAYERLRVSGPEPLSWGSFLKELAETYRVIERERPRGVMAYLAAPAPRTGIEPGVEERLVNEEIGTRIVRALESLAADERAAVRLYVVEGLPAADVARMVGWPGARTVYNRVYRALSGLRRVLEESGLDPSDL